MDIENSVKRKFEAFLSRLQLERLKTLGFRKKGHTFSRERASFWERFNFQASVWNSSSDSTYTYYLNAGVQFKDIEERDFWVLFSHTHWATRVDAMLPELIHERAYSPYSPDEEEALAEYLVRLITEASEKMEADMPSIHAAALNGEFWEEL